MTYRSITLRIHPVTFEYRGYYNISHSFQIWCSSMKNIKSQLVFLTEFISSCLCDLSFLTLTSCSSSLFNHISITLLFRIRFLCKFCHSMFLFCTCKYVISSIPVWIFAASLTSKCGVPFYIIPALKRLKISSKALLFCYFLIVLEL